MMDRSAVEAIRDLAVMGDGNAELAGKGIVLVPEKHIVQNLERFGDAPKRFRGVFKTDAVKPFIAYVNINASELGGVFVKGKTATAILDMGGPGAPQWGQHQAILNLDTTPECARLLKHRENKLSQLDFIDFIEDMPECFVFLDGGGEPVDLVKAKSAIRKLTVTASADKTREVGDFAESYSDLDRIAVSSDGDPLPAGFRFMCRPHVGFNNQVFECRLRAVVGDKSCGLIYRIVGFESLMEAIEDEFVKILGDGITADGVAFYRGTMDYQPGQG